MPMLHSMRMLDVSRRNLRESKNDAQHNRTKRMVRLANFLLNKKNKKPENNEIENSQKILRLHATKNGQRPEKQKLKNNEIIIGGRQKSMSNSEGKSRKSKKKKLKNQVSKNQGRAPLTVNKLKLLEDSWCSSSAPNRGYTPQ